MKTLLAHHTKKQKKPTISERLDAIERRLSSIENSRSNEAIDMFKKLQQETYVSKQNVCPHCKRPYLPMFTS